MTPVSERFQYEGSDLEAMSEAHRYRDWVLSRFRPFLGDDVAEIGAGNGTFTAYLAREVGRSLTSLEPAREQFDKIPDAMVAPIAFERLHGTLAAHAERLRGRFDSVVYVNVLEHVEDDRAELALAASALRPGGHLCVFVPALPALMSDFDRRVGHYRRYTLPQLRAVAIGAGFDIVDLRYMDSLGAPAWYVFMRLMRGNLTAARTRAYDRLVVPWLRALESVVKPPFGKSLVLVARRP